MKIFINIAILSLISGFAHGFGTNAPALEVQATVTCTDGTVAVLQKLNINGTTDMIVYMKPEKVKSSSQSEVILEINPHDNSVGPLQLSSMKNIIFKNPQISYIYQEPSKASKNIYKEIEVDQKSYLIGNNWKLHGIDAETHQQRKIDLHIVEKIAITEVRAKSNTPELSCPPCVCPMSK